MNNHSNDHIIVTKHVIMVENSEISEMSCICNEIVEEPLYYEMPLDDYEEEHIVHDNNGILDFDETNVMKHDEDISLNVNVENNTNNNRMNENELQKMYDEYKQKGLLRTDA